MKKFIGLMVMSCLLILLACKDDDQADSQQPTSGIEVQGDIVGKVIDNNDNPVPDATVKIASITYQTDAQGVFSISGISMNTGGTYISVSKNGYFHSSTRIYPTEEGSVQYPLFKLIPMVTADNINASTGGSVNISGGGTVTFPANAISTQGGQAYNGNVRVAAVWLDPTSDDLNERMPGSLEAMDTNGENVVLATYGMVGVELRDDNGNELDIAVGSQAEIRFPVPVSLLSDAPNQIPLWYFDETDGIWREEGSADLQGNEYVGSVSHFSFWNCDAPYPLVNIDGMITDASNNPLEGEKIRIRANGTNRIGYGFTDQNGKFGGKMPKNKQLSLEIIDACNQIFYTQNLGTFNSDATISPIAIPVSSSSTTKLINVMGNVEECNGGAVANGYVVVEYAGKEVVKRIENDGTFSFSLLVCNSPDITIYAVNTDNLVKSDTFTFSALTNITTGALTTCNAITGEYISINVNGKQTNFIDPVPQAYIESNIPNSTTGYFQVSAYLDTLQIFSFGFAIDGVGSYANTNFGYTHIDLTSNDPLSIKCNGPSAGCTFNSVVITDIDSVGGYIKGSFSGVLDYDYTNSGVQSVPVSGSFAVIREF